MWAEIEKELSMEFGNVRLLVDGYDVVLRATQIAPLKLGVVVFVNGWSKGEWTDIKNDCEEGRRFLQTVKRRLYTAKHLKQMKPYFTRAELELARKKAFEFRRTYWTSVTAMRRHFQKHNTDIQLVRIGHGEPHA